MVAVFGAMSLTNPAHADIDASPAPTAMAVEADSLMAGAATMVPNIPDSDPEMFTFADDKYDPDNFAGVGPGPEAAADPGPMYVIEFELTGAFSETDDRIIIELPAGVEGEDGALALDNGDDNEVTVFGPRNTAAEAGIRVETISTSAAFGFLDGLEIGYTRDAEIVENPGVKHLSITLSQTPLDAERGADVPNSPDPVMLRVTIPGMVNPSGHSGHDVNIYHYTRNENRDTDSNDPAIVGPVRTATLMINSVMVEEKDGDYTLTFVAQKDYRANSELVIMMDNFGMGSTIIPDDVQIMVGGDVKAPRDVDQNSGASTVTLNVPNPGIDKGQKVVVTFFESAGITNPSAVGIYPWEVDGAESADHASLPVKAEDVVDPVTGDGPDLVAVFEATSNTPGKVTRYEFTIPLEKETNTLIHDMVIELEDFGFPSSIGTSSVAVTTNSGTSDTDKHFTFTPEDVAISGEKLLLSMGDITEDTAGVEAERSGIYLLGGDEPMTHMITVVIRTTAGISNPTESNSYQAQVEFGTNDFEDVVGIFVPRVVGLDEEDGGRGDEITVTGKGYKNGTSVTFWRDEMTQVMWDHDSNDNSDIVRLLLEDKADYIEAVMDDATRGSHMYPLPDFDNTVQWNHDGNNNTPTVTALVAPNGAKDPNEERLCSAVADGQDVASCKFEVTNPPFVGGDISNYVNGVDGRGNTSYVNGDDDQRFLLLPSISATPNGGSPGEVMLVQLADFPPGASVTQVELSRRDICGGDAVNPSGTPIHCQGSTDGSGNVNISVVIPNWAEPGKQELKVSTANDGDDNITVDISGPIITPTPRSVVANQRVSLVGSGFFAGAKIGDCEDCGNAAITIGGDQIAWPRINGNDDVNVDNGGNWSAAVDLPLTSATTAAGKRTIRVTDSRGRTGTVDITIPGREVSITPTLGRVGTEAVVRGSNFPSKNDDGDSFNVVIIYDAGNGKQATVTAVPDASGRFETPLRIPTTAGIPSTNTVKVEFDDSNDVKVVTTVTHEVPEGAITLSEYSGAPGSEITISGEGFKAFVPVQSVKVGNIEVTPSPNPSTDGQGMLGFEVTIPGLDNGIQTVEVKVSGTTASEGFTVRPSGVSAGDIKASAEAIVNLGDNFVRSFNFNNDTKSWTFYSPEAPDDSTQTSFITRESYWILIGESQEVILNGKTRNLTCASGSCWNQIVW